MAANNPSEEVVVANQPTPTVKATVTPKSFVEQYELGDTEPASEIDENAAPVESRPVEPQSEKTDRPRAPDGKFLPKNETPEPATPTLPARLVRMAEELGFSEDDLSGASKEQVEDWIFAANKSQAKARKAESLLEVRDRRKPEGEQPVQVERDEFEDLIEAGWGRELVDTIKSKMTAQENRIKQLEAQVGNLGQAERRRQVQTFAEKLDGAIDKLNMPTLFGSGRGSDMDPEGLEFKRRVKIAEEIERDKSKKSFEAKVKAAGALFGYADSKPVATPTKQLPPVDNNGPSPRQNAAANGHDDFEEEWVQGSMARPTNRVATEPKGERKAIDTARKYMAANGLLDRDADDKSGFLE